MWRKLEVNLTLPGEQSLRRREDMYMTTFAFFRSTKSFFNCSFEGAIGVLIGASE